MFSRLERSKSDGSAIRSRSTCPLCGNPLYYVRTFFFFLTKRRKRACLAQDCGFEDSRRFHVTGHRRR